MKFEPTIVMDFNQKRLKFEKPLQVWQTSKLENVREIFKKVQEAINGQYYVAGFHTSALPLSINISAFVSLMRSFH
ncbi:hypothetical protein [Paenibacillus tyrfis]|uniref:hypothetical protein n=1 Tax=Paenibacillus tyrfis TaxID=1501230 RepID=UPI000B58B3FE|nr:hypothetical protein [Paenibacillus tyrfis]